MATPSILCTITHFRVLFFLCRALLPVPVALGLPFPEQIK
jgi:hypothetical protein